MKKLLFIILMSLALFAHSTTSHHPAYHDDGFLEWTKSLVTKIKEKPDYQKIPIDSDEQTDHFTRLLYQAYKKDISKGQFINKVEIKYPVHSKSIHWLADQLPK